jgi:putative transposase
MRVRSARMPAGRTRDAAEALHGVSEQTFYRWKNKYGDLELHEARRRYQLEDANARLKRLVADLTLDKQVLKDLLGKKA